MKRVFFIILILSCSNVCMGQEWAELFQQSQQHLVDEEYSLAMEKANACLENYMVNDGSANGNYAAILRSLVNLHFIFEDYNKSIEYGEKELQVRKSVSEVGDETYATTLFNLGSAYQMTDQYEKAIESFSESYEVYADLLEQNDYELLRVQWKLASSYYYSGDDERAGELFANAFDRLETDEVDNDYLLASFDYANLLSARGDYEAAEPLATQLVDIYKANDLTGEEIYAQSLKISATAALQGSKQGAEDLFDSAVESLKEVYSESPATLSSQLNQWAVSLRDIGLNDYSDSLLEGVSAEGGSDAMSLNNLAVLAFNEGRYADATRHYVEALGLLDKTKTADQRTYAVIAENMVKLLEALGENEKALNLQKEAVELNISSGQEPGIIARSEAGLGRVLKINNQLDEALQYYSSSLEKLTETNLDRAESLNGLASLHQQMGNYGEAEIAYKEALSIFEANPGRGLAAVLNNMGSFYKERGQFLLSKRFFDRALDQVENTHGSKSSAYANTQQNLALLLLELGEYGDAEKYISSALEIVEGESGKTHRNYSAALLNYGRIMLAQGKYKEAEPAFREVLDIRREALGNTHILYAEALNSLAFFYQTLGNFAQAEPLLRESLDIYKSVGGDKTTNYANSLENLATLYQLKGDYSEAKPLLEEALEIDRILVGEDHPLYSTTLHNLASLYKEVGELDNSETLFRQALSIDEKTYGEEHPSYAKTLYNLATLLQDKEDYEGAEQLFQKVTDIRSRILGENHPDYAYSLYGMASIKRVLEKPEALDYYQRAIEKYLFQISEYFPALSEKEKSAFYEKIRPVFDSFKDYAIEEALKGNKEVLELLYDLQLSTKALLLNSTSKIRQRILNSGDNELISTFGEWLSLKERLIKYYNLTLEEIQTEGIDLEALTARANDLEKDISAKSELFSREIDKSGISWEDVKSSLQEGQAAIEIFRIERTFDADSVYYTALLLEPGFDTPELAIFNYGNQLESRMFNYYRNAIKFTIGDKISFENYWVPLEEKLTDVNTVYISSDGIFNKISYPTLWDFRSNIYVLDEFDIRLVSNTREIVEEHPTDAGQGKTASVFGNPDFGNRSLGISETRTSAYGFSGGVPGLPGTKVEIETLAETLQGNQWNSKIFVEHDASEENFKGIESPRLLHIATHGFFMSDLDVEEESKAFGIHLQNEKANPLFRSGLLFSGSNETLFGEKERNGEDGILTAYEAMNLNLDRTELVVMSACETGLGAIKNGEGVYGLQRAFLVAGAKSVIMSLWKVNDETTQMLMNRFYNYWLSGDDKIQAFTRAQLDLKKEFPDPYHWGAFVILGE